MKKHTKKNAIDLAKMILVAITMGVIMTAVIWGLGLVAIDYAFINKTPF